MSTSGLADAIPSEKDTPRKLFRAAGQRSDGGFSRLDGRRLLLGRRSVVREPLHESHVILVGGARLVQTAELALEHRTHQRPDCLIGNQTPVSGSFGEPDDSVNARQAGLFILCRAVFRIRHCTITQPIEEKEVSTISVLIFHKMPNDLDHRLLIFRKGVLAPFPPRLNFFLVPALELFLPTDISVFRSPSARDDSVDHDDADHDRMRDVLKPGRDILRSQIHGAEDADRKDQKGQQETDPRGTTEDEDHEHSVSAKITPQIVAKINLLPNVYGTNDFIHFRSWSATLSTDLNFKSEPRENFPFPTPRIAFPQTAKPIAVANAGS